GASLSNTVTKKLQVEVLPSLSVTESSTVVSPTGNTLPLGGVATMEEEILPSSSSIATPAKLAMAPQVPASLFITISAGQAITGGLPIGVDNPMVAVQPGLVRE